MVILFLTEEFRIDVTLAKLMKVNYHINRWEEKKTMTNLKNDMWYGDNRTS